MKLLVAFTCLTFFLTQHAWGDGVAKESEKEAVEDFSFAQVKYFHRFTNGTFHEYTPSGQEDLRTWKDMVTLHVYPKAKDEAALAAVANAVLANYKANEAIIVKTDFVAKSREKPAEHLIVARFGRPEFVEAVFARFRMHDGVATGVIYSRRAYGAKAGDEMSRWHEANGAAMEKALMEWTAMPQFAAPAEERQAAKPVADTAPGFDEPEEAVRALYMAVFKRDKEGLERAALPNAELSILLQGRDIPASEMDGLIAWARRVHIRRAKIGEKVIIPTSKGPVELVFDERYINADRQQLITDDDPLPTIVVRDEHGRWRADPKPFIAARKAAAKAAARAANPKAPGGDGPATRPAP